MKGITKEDILTGQHAGRLLERKEHIDQKNSYIKWLLILFIVLGPYFRYSFVSEKLSISHSEAALQPKEEMVEEKITPYIIQANGLSLEADSKIKITGTLAGGGEFCAQTSKAIKNTYTILILKVNGRILPLSLATKNSHIKKLLSPYEDQDYIVRNLGQKITIWGKKLINKTAHEKAPLEIYIDAIQIGHDFYADRTDGGKQKQ